MKLYHGSNIVVDCPVVEKGRPFKDFGRVAFLSYSEISRTLLLVSIIKAQVTYMVNCRMNYL